MNKGVCDDGIACERAVDVELNEYGYCQKCVEQRDYENDKFPQKN